MSPDPQSELDVVFFDIGGTLGIRDAETGQFSPFPDSAELLRSMKNDLGMRVGIITTLGSTLTNAEAMTMLDNAGLKEFIDAALFISEHDAGVAKPHRRIYQFAAQAAGITTERCLFIGENLVEVAGALAAGMKAMLKPTP